MWLTMWLLLQCRRHQMVLPNGTRAGFFIGDAAGVGKGRQVRCVRSRDGNAIRNL